MSESASIPVLIIHHDPLVRACMAAALGARAAIDVRCVMPDAAGVAAARALPRDGVVIADHAAALAVTSSATTRGLPPPSLVVVASCDREWELRNALEQRVRGYLSPGFEAQQLIDCVAAVHGGGRYLCQRTATRLAESLSYEPLTGRERAVVGLVVRGLPNKSIGRELGISLGTVKSHLKAGYAKLQVASRTQAIAEVQRRGLLEQASEHTAPRTVARSPALREFMQPPHFLHAGASGTPQLCVA